MATVKRHYCPWFRNLYLKSPWAPVRKLFSSVRGLHLSWKGSENSYPKWHFPWFSPDVFALWDRKALANWTAFDNDVTLGCALFSLRDDLHSRAGDYMLVTVFLLKFSVNQVGTAIQVATVYRLSSRSEQYLYPGIYWPFVFSVASSCCPVLSLGSLPDLGLQTHPNLLAPTLVLILKMFSTNLFSM